MRLMAGDKKKAWETFRQEVTQSCGPKAAARWIDDKTRPKGQWRVTAVAAT